MKSLKNILTGLIAVFLITLILAPYSGKAQVVNASTKKRIGIGVGLFNDFWMNKPAGMTTRAINQGVTVFGTYNVPFGKSNFSFALGVGISIHNLFWNYRFQGDSTAFQFVQVKSPITYKRSKLSMPYLEIPLEFRYKTKSKVAMGLGFKLGYMVYGHAKWVGDDYLFNTTNTLTYSVKDIKNIEKFAYGPTLRVGYKWFHLTAYYSLSQIFTKSTGVDMYPISVGFVLLPF